MAKYKIPRFKELVEPFAIIMIVLGRKRPARRISVSVGLWHNFAQFGGVCKVQ